MKNHECGAVKTCSNCLIEKSILCFSANYKCKDGRLTQCKDCMKVKRQNLKFTNLGLYEKQLEASRLVKKVLGKEYLKIYKRDWDSRNSEYVKSYRKDYYEANKEKCKQNGTLNWKSKKRASVKWADRKAILEFYREAKRLTKLTGIQFHVDHVIPLNGKNVSGLHVETNLQTIPWLFNNMKYNSFTDDIC